MDDSIEMQAIQERVKDLEASLAAKRKLITKLDAELTALRARCERLEGAIGRAKNLLQSINWANGTIPYKAKQALEVETFYENTVKRKSRKIS